MDTIATFQPAKTPIADFPHPVGQVVLGSLGMRYVVTDRDGYAFLACCALHDQEGVASGWYPQHNNGRPLATFTPATPEQQAHAEAVRCPFAIKH